MSISSINFVVNKALWGLRSQISLVRLYQYQNDFTGKSIPKNIQLIYTRRRSFWVVILSIKYKLVYDVVRNWPLFGILPLCLCNSISGCISKTGHLGTNKNLSRPTSSCNSSSFLIHLFVSAPPSTSAEDKTHFGFLLQQHPYFARVLSNFLPSLESTLVAFLWGTPITTLCDGSTHRLFLCSTGAQQSSPLSIHLSCLAG